MRKKASLRGGPRRPKRARHFSLPDRPTCSTTRLTVVFCVELAIIAYISSANLTSLPSLRGFAGNGSSPIGSDKPVATEVLEANVPVEPVGFAAVAAQKDPASWVIDSSGRYPDGRIFDVDADVATLKWSPRTISVVLPCAEEMQYALQTVKSVYENTPRDVLHEIIVVDDGSDPPLAETHLTPDIQRQYGVKLLRHETTVGLICAKKTGGDAMTGDIGVFFDCHVAPQPGWHESIIRLISENYRRMVVPQITSLNVDTWAPVAGSSALSKCYLTLDADFKWYQSEDPYIAVMSGGLITMSRRWWIETGGYDEMMLGWGGENIDQSLRMWLCGGEIMAAADSLVAHMWRSGEERTKARYRAVGDSSANRARGVYAWYSEFVAKLSDFPSLNPPIAGVSGPWYGDISNILEYKNKLRCRPFQWFLRRFKSIYEDAGVIPPEVFMLREESSGLCLRFSGLPGTAAGGNGEAQLMPCGDTADGRLYWHTGNRRLNGQCCSGLRAWNTDQCLHEVASGLFKTFVCAVDGRDRSQMWSLTQSRELRQIDKCAVYEGNTLQVMKCAVTQTRMSRWSRASSKVPLETELYLKTRRDHPEVFASAEKQLDGLYNDTKETCKRLGGCFSLFWKDGSFTKCLDDTANFQTDLSACTVHFVDESSGQVRVAHNRGLCLDEVNDNNPETWTYFSCHNGSNQKFSRRAAVSAFSVCGNSGACLEGLSLPANKTEP